MDISNAIIDFRRSLKRKNYSRHTVKNYLNTLKHYLAWLDVPVELATPDNMAAYIDYLLDKRLHPKTINCHINNIRRFYDFLQYQEGVRLENPVKNGIALRQPRALPRTLKDEEILGFLKRIKKRRDKAIFKLMLRCGLRVEEVANLSLAAMDLKRRKVLVKSGKGYKDRMVYVSNDACQALTDYLKIRPASDAKQVFLVEKGIHKGKPISVRGIQKRIEYYARKAALNISCHQLRHTMATQMLNADASLSTIQDLLGHNRISTTQIYCKVSNMKVQRDYHKAMESVMLKTTPEEENFTQRFKH